MARWCAAGLCAFRLGCVEDHPYGWRTQPCSTPPCRPNTFSTDALHHRGDLSVTITGTSYERYGLLKSPTTQCLFNSLPRLMNKENVKAAQFLAFVSVVTGGFPAIRKSFPWYDAIVRIDRMFRLIVFPARMVSNVQCAWVHTLETDVKWRTLLIYLALNKMTDILQTTFSNAFSSKKSILFYITVTS